MSLEVNSYDPPPQSGGDGIVRVLFSSIFGLVGLSLLVFACPMLLVAGGLYYAFDYSRADWVLVDGQVTDMRQSESFDSDTGSSSTSFCPTVAFTTQAGETLEINVNECSTPAAHRTGDQVEVLYDPDQPESMQIKGGVGDTVTTILSLIFGVIGGGFLCVGGLMAIGGVIVAIRKRR